MKLKTNWYFTKWSVLNQVLEMQYFSWSFKKFLDFASTLRHIPLNMGVKWRRFETVVKTLNFVYSIWNIFVFVLSRNGHFHNVVSTFTNVAKLDVENDSVVSTLSSVVHIKVEIHNIYSTLFDVVNSIVEIHNVVSTLIWRCPTSQCRINQKQC